MDASPRCLLIVEDSQTSREGLQEYFSAVGFVVHACGDGAEAEGLARHVMPALVVLDLELPGIDGWEVARRLKADEQTKRIPIVAMTAHHLPQERASAVRAGCDAYVAKPCEPIRLLEQILKMLDPQDRDP